MEPIIVALISVTGGFVSGLVVALAKPVGENWLETRRERRALRRDALDRLADSIRLSHVDGHYLRIAARPIVDPELTEHVGRYIVAATDDQRSNTRGDAAQRIGQLRGKL